MAIDVTVHEFCDRCKRKVPVTIPSDKIEEYEAKQKLLGDYKQKVEEFVKANQGALPDLVVIFKGQVQLFGSVCDAHCAKTVESGMNLLFREYKERKPRQKKKSKPAEDAAPAAQADAAAKAKKNKPEVAA